jgi:hypothetical protein
VSRCRLFVVLSVLCIVLHIATLPNHFNEAHYYYGDTGSTLMAVELTNRGATPWLDFYYTYGFATLWVNQAWYQLFGATPLANHVLNLLSRLLMAWAMADLMVVMGWNRQRSTVGLVLLTSPYLFCFLWYTLAHTMESALVILSISQAVRLRFTPALLWATLALLFKPVLAYFLGLALILLMLNSGQAASWNERMRLMMRWMLPSLLLLLTYTAVVISVWGIPVFLNSLMPLSALKGYEEMAHGFFTQGSLFWLPRHHTVPQVLEHYLLTPAGLWIVGTVYLLMQTLLALLLWSRTKTPSSHQVCIVLCGVLHLVFILVLFGNEWSWLYSPYLLVFGVAAARVARLDRDSESEHNQGTIIARESPYFLPIFLVLVVCSLTPTISNSTQSWRQTRTYADRHHLFMSEDYHQELEQVTKLAKQHRLLLVTKQGAPGVLLPVHGVPTWAYIRMPTREAERAGFREQMIQATIMVFPKHYFHMIEWPEVAEQLKHFRLAKSTPHFQYWVRPEAEKLFPPANARPL